MNDTFDDPDFWEAVKTGNEAAVLQRVAEDPRWLKAGHASGYTPLRLAWDCGHQALAHKLAECSPPDAFEACAVGDLASLQDAVRQHGVEARSGDGWTALHLAAFYGRPRLVEWLLATGADLEAVAANGMANRPLHAAIAGQRDPAVIRLLLDAGVEVQAAAASGITPLHLAASRGDQQLVADLIEHGADPAATMDDGRTPADLAAERGFPALAERLRR